MALMISLIEKARDERTLKWDDVVRRVDSGEEHSRQRAQQGPRQEFT